MFKLQVVTNIHQYSLDACFDRISKPKIILRWGRGSVRFNLLARKEDYDALGLDKAANNIRYYFHQCSLCKVWKNTFCKMWYHICSVDHNLPAFKIQKALEEKERESIQSQLGDRILNDF